MGARIRDEQPARLLEHVSRGKRAGADRFHRDRQGHDLPGGLGQGRSPDSDGRQRGVQRAADAHIAGRGSAPRGADRARQPARRGRVASHDRAARLPRHGDEACHADGDHGHPAAHRRRPGAAAGRGQGRPRARRDGSRGHRRAVPAATHRRLRRLPQAGGRDRLGRAGAPVGRRRGAHPRPRRALPARRPDHRRLVPRDHSTGARCGHRQGDREPAAAARQHRPRGRRNLARARAQQRPGQPHLRRRTTALPLSCSTGSRRSAGSGRRGRRGWTPSGRSARCSPAP